MKTKEQLIDEHYALFSDGADVHASFLAGEYVGQEDIYHNYMTVMRAKMTMLELLIDHYGEPENHE